MAIIAAPTTTALADQIGYLGPAGSWTHQACLDLFGPSDLVAMSSEELFATYADGKVGRICVPVATSLVGPTPYLGAIVDLPQVTIVAEYPKMLGYSLLVRPGTRRGDLKEILAHPVALEEVRPWLDREIPQVRRIEAASAGAAAQAVASSTTLDKGSVGPRIGASIYGLESLLDGIEEGPNNVTRWWVLGRTTPPPSGNDKTSLLATVKDGGVKDRDLASLLSSFANGHVQILTIYDRPAKQTVHTHRYLIEVAGHAKLGELAELLAKHPDIRVLGSYPRRY
jgi:prephenate dehydratase